MWLIAGLGNPGAKYLLNRHNIGFMALDSMVGENAPWRHEHQALTLKAKCAGHEVLLVKPQTFMNLSGQSVRALVDYYKISLDHVIVAHDEIDIPFSAIRIQRNRGAAGHNGIKSISADLGSQDYLRLKLGVSRPSHPGFEIAAYVLQNFSDTEMTAMPEFLERSHDAIEMIVAEGFEKAATRFNQKGST